MTPSEYSSLSSVLVAGFIAGMLHVVSGPDHLAAVAPIAVGQRKRSWLIGARWGIGHASGVALVAFLAWLLRELLPIEKFSSMSERFVGVMLIAIGLWGLRKAWRLRLHAHIHLHEDGPHARARAYSHVHFHSHSEAERHEDSAAHLHTHAALVVGIFHGLAGASHFLGVLPALAMPTRTLAAFYLLSFGIGTIGSMAAFSSSISFLGSRFQLAGLRSFNLLMASLSMVAVGVGGYWLVF